MTTKEFQELLGQAKEPVTTISDFKRKYGEVGWRLTIEEFLKRAPSFPGEGRLGMMIGIIMADLESALKDVPIDNG